MGSDKERQLRASDAEEFVKKHWPIILTAAGVFGAAIFLTARYLLEKKRIRDAALKRELEMLAEDGLATGDDAVALLEGGESVIRVVGADEASQAAAELAEHVSDERVAEGLLTFSEMAKSR